MPGQPRTVWVYEGCCACVLFVWVKSSFVRAHSVCLSCLSLFLSPKILIFFSDWSIFPCSSSKSDVSVGVPVCFR
uniref:Uncharacterized protein n=1 Tax=Arundo donax TaxID=35708 RepID=A0A0A9GU77_ARUDO